MRFIVAAFAAIMLAVAPAAASQCVPLPSIGAQIQAAGIPPDNVYASEDVAFVDLYTKALGVPLPDGAAPVGILFVINGNAVFVGLVENRDGYCVAYNMTIPLAAHKAAFFAASRQA